MADIFSGPGYLGSPSITNASTYKEIILQFHRSIMDLKYTKEAPTNGVVALSHTRPRRGNLHLISSHAMMYSGQVVRSWPNNLGQEYQTVVNSGNWVEMWMEAGHCIRVWAAMVVIYKHHHAFHQNWKKIEMGYNISTIFLSSISGTKY